ncbi:MAG: hypothetical protein DID90_2727552814 [Candidatus Nitrotoga sp. LAW]|nr:MAG: hypothetical protein DID90_2727552814 [Candidatus Nitrotoga sp. LAW]
MYGNIFCEQQRIVTRRVKQAIPEGDARKSEFLIVDIEREANVVGISDPH